MSTRPDVLVVDDDPDIRAALDRGLRLSGFDVRTACDGRDALRQIAEAEPDVIVLDVTMPEVDGVEVCERLRAGGFNTPVCMLSARDETDDRKAGLRAGADDYLIKPFDLEELELRLRGLLRRAGADTTRASTSAAGIDIDTERRLASVDGAALDLTRREFDLLLEFVEHSEIVLSRQQLLERVWGYDFEVNTNVVDVFVGYLRRKLEADDRPRRLHTVRGVGFVLRP